MDNKSADAASSLGAAAEQASEAFARLGNVLFEIEAVRLGFKDGAEVVWMCDDLFLRSRGISGGP